MFRIGDSRISLDDLVAHVGRPDAGAIATFLGSTRSSNRGRRVLELEYEAYESMAVAEFEKIAERARARWELCEVAIVHRIGSVPIGETYLEFVNPKSCARYQRESLDHPCPFIRWNVY